MKKEAIRRWLPILSWMPGYSKEFLKGDLVAGLTVGIMLIPQGMAYAMIAGMPPIYGLYASTIPLLIYALLGTSRQLAVGPVAMVSLLTATGVAALAETGTEGYIQWVIALAFLVGLMQAALGFFRLGFLVTFLSHPVISGFTSAAALIIGLSQVKHLLGVSIPKSEHVYETVYHLVNAAGKTHWVTLLIGLVGVGIIVGIRRFSKSFPGALVVVLLSTLAVYIFQWQNEGVKIIGEIPAGFPPLSLDGLDWSKWVTLLPLAATISLVSFMESISVAKAIQARHRNYQVDPNQELIALGAANIGGAFFQGFPVTGGFSRTAVNDQAGARTGMASIFSAVLIILTLLFLTPLFYYLPNAVLGAIILVAVAGLFNYKEALHLWKVDRSDFLMLIVTFISTLILGIELGIALGVGLSIAAVIYQTTRPHYAVLGRIPGRSFYKNVDRFPDLEVREDILVVRFDARLYFANTPYFKEVMESLIDEKGDGLRLVVLDADSINGMDSTAVLAVEELLRYCRQRKILLSFTGAKGPVRDMLFRSGLLDEIGQDQCFMRIQDAVDAFDQMTEVEKRGNSRYSLQTNELKK